MAEPAVTTVGREPPGFELELGVKLYVELEPELGTTIVLAPPP